MIFLAHNRTEKGTRSLNELQKHLIMLLEHLSEDFTDSECACDGEGDSEGMSYEACYFHRNEETILRAIRKCRATLPCICSR